VSWCGDQLKLPHPLPAVPAKVRRPSPFRYRYCFNYCAFSYTLAFWDWPQWERMIDWMALNGINVPLAVSGQEAVWRQVYRELKLSDREIGEFLVGPAYLPFGWLGRHRRPAAVLRVERPQPHHPLGPARQPPALHAQRLAGGCPVGETWLE